MDRRPAGLPPRGLAGKRRRGAGPAEVSIANTRQIELHSKINGGRYTIDIALPIADRKLSVSYMPSRKVSRGTVSL